MDPAFFFRYPGACDAESPEGNHPDGRIHESIVFHSEAAGMGSGGLCKETHREGRDPYGDRWEWADHRADCRLSESGGEPDLPDAGPEARISEREEW